MIHDASRSDQLGPVDEETVSGNMLKLVYLVVEDNDCAFPSSDRRDNRM